MTIPARSWAGVTDEDSERTDLTIGGTDPGDNCVVLAIGGESVVLDPTPIRELVTELLRRLVLIDGRQAAVDAAADASVAALTPAEPPPVRWPWHVPATSGKPPGGPL